MGSVVGRGWDRVGIELLIWGRGCELSEWDSTLGNIYVGFRDDAWIPHAM